MERKGVPGKRFSPAFRHEVVNMYIETDATLRTLSKKIGVSNSTIWRWIAKFAEENPTDARIMNKIRANSVNYGPKKVNGESVRNDEKEVVAPDSSSIDTTPALSTEEELRLLKIQLQREKLRADAYEEMINVAESKFNIKIRKKAGAKQ